MSVNATLLGQILFASMVIFAIGLSRMARRRGLSASGWAVVGLIPIVNFVGWIILLCIRETSP